MNTYLSLFYLLPNVLHKYEESQKGMSFSLNGSFHCFGTNFPRNFEGVVSGSMLLKETLSLLLICKALTAFWLYR